jgi:hypothetical protein
VEDKIMKAKKKLYALHFTLGDTTIYGIEEGKIGAWVARLGGDDKQLEQLLLHRKVEIARETLTIMEDTSK